MWIQPLEALCGGPFGRTITQVGLKNRPFGRSILKPTRVCGLCRAFMVEILTHAPTKLTNAGLQKRETRSFWLVLMRFGWSQPPTVRQHRLKRVGVAHAIPESAFMVEILIFLPQGPGGRGRGVLGLPAKHRFVALHFCSWLSGHSEHHARCEDSIQSAATCGNRP